MLYKDIHTKWLLSIQIDPIFYALNTSNRTMIYPTFNVDGEQYVLLFLTWLVQVAPFQDRDDFYVSCNSYLGVWKKKDQVYLGALRELQITYFENSQSRDLRPLNMFLWNVPLGFKLPVDPLARICFPFCDNKALLKADLCFCVKLMAWLRT